TEFALACQPQTRFSVSLCSGDGKTGENHQALTWRKIGERIYLFAAPASQNPAAQQKERDVRPQLGSQRESPARRQLLTRQPLQSLQRRRRVAAGSAQAASRGNHLLQARPHPAAKAGGAPPEIAGPMHEVFPTGGDLRIVALETCSFSGPRERNLQPVMKRNSLINGADFVIAVGALGQKLKPQVNLCEGAETSGLFQIISGQHVAWQAGASGPRALFAAWPPGRHRSRLKPPGAIA